MNAKRTELIARLLADVRTHFSNEQAIISLLNQRISQPKQIERLADQLSDFVLRKKSFYPLLTGDTIATAYRQLAMQHNVVLVSTIMNEKSLNGLFEKARSAAGSDHIRDYLDIFRTYHHYFTDIQLKTLLEFLYARLSYNDELVRRMSAELIGQVLTQRYTEQQFSSDVLKDNVQRFLKPDVSVPQNQIIWLGQAFKYFVKSYVDFSTNTARDQAVDAIVSIVDQDYDVETDDSYTIAALSLVVSGVVNDAQLNRISQLAERALMRQQGNTRLCALELLNKCLHRSLTESDFIKNKIKEPSTLYLSNLKSATPSIVKRQQIQQLENLVHSGQADAFYTAMHFSNVLKVSAYFEVRESAGEALVRLFEHLSEGQKNDIVIELIRSLEIDGYRFTKFIPEYLGKIINFLSIEEYNELIDDFNDKVKVAPSAIAVLVLSTAAESLRHRLTGVDGVERFDIAKVKLMFNVLLNGLVHYHQKISDRAFYYIATQIFGNPDIPLAVRGAIYATVAKKVLTCANAGVKAEVSLSNAAAYQAIDAFIEQFEGVYGPLYVDMPQRAAFFPGTFDPFSLAHLNSAKSIRDLGFEVYLAIDEFSWSKRTQPNNVRRKIVNMSIADDYHIYTFPKEIIVNIANASDLKALKQAFAPRDIYLVMGSDVLTHASAYRLEEVRKTILTFSHVIFERAEGMGNTFDAKKLEAVIAEIEGDVQRLTLNPAYEKISSTQIRSYIDQNRDISDLIESMAQSYIYDKGYYRHEPLFKDTMTVRSTNIEVVEQIDQPLIDELCQRFALDKVVFEQIKQSNLYENAARILLIRDLQHDNAIIAFSLFHWLRSSMIYHEFSSDNLSNYIRNNALGRIVVVDALCYKSDSQFRNLAQVILTETLAFVLAKDYSYAIYKNLFEVDDAKLNETLLLQGFVNQYDDAGHGIACVDMNAPITINLDGKAMIKQPYRNDDKVVAAIEQARKQIQQALCQFKPGHLVLSFDRTMIYEHLIKRICDANDVSTIPVEPRQLGACMCVTYGDLFKRSRLPNTVTKALHTERFYDETAQHYQVRNHPNYLDLDIQTMTIKSFNRPVILVDDLVDKGHRLKSILQDFQRQDIAIKSVNAAVLTGRGKAWLEMQQLDFSWAYYLPKIAYWFNESMLYPFIGGDSIDLPEHSNINALASINLILPYTYPVFLKGVAPRRVALFSMACLKSTQLLLKAIEDNYLSRHAKNLTLENLSDVFVSPRYPYKGDQLSYQRKGRPSEIITSEISYLQRIIAHYEENADV